MEIEGLVNKINGNSLLEDIPLLRRTVQRSVDSATISGWIATDLETYDAVTRYIMQELGIPESNGHDVFLDQNLRKLDHIYFLERKDEYFGTPDSVHLVRIRGFEKILVPDGEYTRSAHDFDQDSGPRKSVNPTWEPPKVMLVNFIDRASGQEMYEKAIASAMVSQFKRFLWEF